MYLKWLWLSCIFSGFLLLTSWVCGESATASDSKAVDRQSQNGLNNALNDSIYVEKIVFYSDRDGNAEIYIMNADGTGLKRLTINSAQDNCPDISPDGNKIAFSSNRDGNYEIYIMNIDGSNQQRLTNTPEYDERHVDWSPDGTRIYYMEDMGVNAAICVMNADGSGDTTLTSGTVRDVRPNVSPDGTKIVFNSTRDGNFEIYFMNIDGSNQQRLTNSPDWEVFPAWSPDGNKIAYGLLDLETHIIEVHVMNADGIGDTALTNTGGINENACWSPDGTEIVFQSDRDGNFEVYKMAADGSNPRRLTNHPIWDGWPSWGVVREPMNKYLGQTPPDSVPKIFAPGIVSTTDGAEYACAFTPDGTEFYFTRYDEATATNNIWVTKLSYNQWTAPVFASFTQGYSYNIEPGISPDGQKLFFISERPVGTPPSIWYVDRIDTGWSAPQAIGEPLSSLGKYGPSVAANGNLYFCQHDGNYHIQIYMAKNNNGVYETPVKLGDEINGFYIAGHPFIAPDENYLLFDAQPNYPASGENYLYISFKRPDDSWYPAIKLNNLINATDFQFCPSVSPDGKYLFFDRGGGEGNIYWVDAEALCVLGDADISGSIDISDVIYLINYLFRGGPAPEPMMLGDTNNDNNVSVSDVVYLINYIFKGGPPPEC